MSRDIKFRAWDKVNKKMVYQGFAVYPSGHIKYLEKGLGFGLKLMQFTNLTDKNDLEVYDGDLLQTQDRIVEVYWNELGIWDSKFIRYTSTPSTKGIERSAWRYDAEVIGNKFENQELINEKNNT